MAPNADWPTCQGRQKRHERIERDLRRRIERDENGLGNDAGGAVEPRHDADATPPQRDENRGPKARAVSAAFSQNRAVPSSSHRWAAVVAGDVSATSPAIKYNTCQVAMMPRINRMESPVRFIASPLQPALQTAIDGVERSVGDGCNQDH